MLSQIYDHGKEFPRNSAVLVQPPPNSRDLENEVNGEISEQTKTGKTRFYHRSGTRDDRLWAVALALYAGRHNIVRYHPVAAVGPSNLLLEQEPWRRVGVQWLRQLGRGTPGRRTGRHRMVLRMQPRKAPKHTAHLSRTTAKIRNRPI
jgi:hypothetical protein